MRPNLHPIIRCESHVNTRLRYVLKLGEIIGFQKTETIVTTTTVTFKKQNESVAVVSTELSALNGESTMKDLVSGVV